MRSRITAVITSAIGHAQPAVQRRWLILPMALMIVTLFSGCAHNSPDDPLDPLEPVNRIVWDVNQTVDKYVLRPVAKGYVYITPGPVRTGVSNFFDNLFYPTVIVSDVLQGKIEQGALDTGRFIVNSTLGIAGIVDVAKYMGLEKHDEDLGQTFGYWGIGAGWYLIMPLTGPTTNRDLVGSTLAGYLSPLTYVDPEIRIPVTALYAVDIRTALLRVDRVLDSAFDPYAFVRGAYLQRREALVNDQDAGGNTPGFF